MKFIWLSEGRQTTPLQCNTVITAQHIQEIKIEQCWKTASLTPRSLSTFSTRRHENSKYSNNNDDDDKQACRVNKSTSSHCQKRLKNYSTPIRVLHGGALMDAVPWWNSGADAKTSRWGHWLCVRMCVRFRRLLSRQGSSGQWNSHSPLPNNIKLCSFIYLFIYLPGLWLGCQFSDNVFNIKLAAN